MEEYKEILGFEGKYWISNLGNVKNSNELVLTPFISHRGYVMHSLSIKKAKSKKCRAHVLVASHFIPNLESKLEVNHKDGNKLNNNVNNLEWVTRNENIQHAKTNKLYKTLEDHASAKLDRNKVEQIIAGLHLGYTQRELAKTFDVSQRTIFNIHHKKIWKEYATV